MEESTPSKSRSEKAKERQIKLAQSFNDNIEFRLLKHNKSSQSTDTLNNIKSERLKQNEKHLIFLNIKNEYDKSDSKEYPSWIFCESTVLDFYKFTNIDLKTNILPLEKIDSRREILENTIDKGDYYFKVRDRLYYKSELNKYISLKNDLLDYLYKMFKDLLTENNFNTFKYCKSILDDSKKNKKKLYIIKNNIQILEDETGINISKFFSVNWNLPELYIPVKKSEKKKNKGIDFEFDLKIDKISEYSNKIIQEDKYIYQTINKIQQKGVSILTGNISDENIIYKQTIDVSFQKKWSELNEEQKIDRLKDYCNNFVINKVYVKLLKTFIQEKKKKTRLILVSFSKMKVY